MAARVDLVGDVDPGGHQGLVVDLAHRVDDLLLRDGELAGIRVGLARNSRAGALEHPRVPQVRNEHGRVVTGGIEAVRGAVDGIRIGVAVRRSVREHRHRGLDDRGVVLGIDEARERGHRPEEAGQPSAQVRRAESAHRYANEGVVATLRQDRVAGQDGRDHGLKLVALPRRAAALTVVPPVCVPAVAPFGHDHDRIETVERLGKPILGVRGVVEVEPVEEDDQGIVRVGVVPGRQEHVRPRRTGIVQPFRGDLASRCWDLDRDQPGLRSCRTTRGNPGTDRHEGRRHEDHYASGHQAMLPTHQSLPTLEHPADRRLVLPGDTHSGCSN